MDQTQAYCESKLYVTALALAVGRLWPNVLSNAVDPGWVPTKMGGAAASDDLEMDTSPKPGLRSATIPPPWSLGVIGITANRNRLPQTHLTLTSRSDSWPHWPN